MHGNHPRHSSSNFFQLLPTSSDILKSCNYNVFQLFPACLLPPCLTPFSWELSCQIQIQNEIQTEMKIQIEDINPSLFALISPFTWKLQQPPFCPSSLTFLHPTHAFNTSTLSSSTALQCQQIHKSTNTQINKYKNTQNTEMISSSTPLHCNASLYQKLHCNTNTNTNTNTKENKNENTNTFLQPTHTFTQLLSTAMQQAPCICSGYVWSQLYVIHTCSLYTKLYRT